MRKNYILLLALVASGLHAQSSVQVVDSYLKNQTVDVNNKKASSQFSNLEYAVVNENVIGDNVADYVKIQQVVNNIPVYQSFGTFQVKDKKVLSFNNNFKLDNANSPKAGLTAKQAMEKYAGKVAKKLVVVKDLENYKHYSQTSKSDNNSILFADKDELLNYYQSENGLKLAWIMLAAMPDVNSKAEKIPLYEVVIDANTGDLLSRASVVSDCSFDAVARKNNTVIKNNPEDYKWIYDGYKESSVASNSGTYRVIPANYESPLKHSFELVTNADDPVASKEGWHKLLNVPRSAQAPMPLTAYHTVGNNARVSSDTDGTASDLIIGSNGLLADLALGQLKEEAYGGENLLFDFPNPGASINYNPVAYANASTTQMFYSINSIHDILHYHGFNPKAGSFQANSGEGFHTTGITVAGLGEEHRTINNAFMIYNIRLFKAPITCFFTFETTKEGAGVFDINTGIYQGTYHGSYGNNSAYNYGVDPVVTGDIALLDDGTGANVHDGCEPVINGAALQDKIVLIDRGNCLFNDKIVNVLPYHPKGIVFLNNSTNPLPLSIAVEGTGDNSNLNFPAVAIELDIANKLKQSIVDGTAPQVTLPSEEFGINKRDSGFDSQVILHEYTHAVSGRITGSAMGGEEGMNEGWSDYVALNLTQQANQVDTDQIDMGSYAFGGGGLRVKPYTTDMSVNPHTYDYLKVIGPGENLEHPTGYLWAVMLWEMHWKFVNKYGFNPDHKSNQGGNNMALDLVLQGQKMQVPNPGFVEGRDAILQADQAMFNGDNKCIIWEAFAKRGLGFSAKQGTSASRIDGTEAFDLPEDCKVLSSNEVNTSNISIYPNPAKDVVYVMTNENVLKAEIFDMLGNLVSSQTINASLQKRSVDTSNLTKGVYILKLHSTEGVVTKKIIKN
ncbi:Por secretion system C-terminal sorting domain-containing protein [Soonwooa buanensis]|uniref:Por secretion system C-terminal sorting domain-containing protein n=1 Tax=Soonwooa buanensis TaxID=619805 RepID=A0A1T5DRB2_9FLAO|nr:M36 family metallopeptidase [Soonwooa buanensis]SKB74175.1 Por secretion system C-terminal sorting domain-containing protein [Soonwooa buanensis]